MSDIITILKDISQLLLEPAASPSLIVCLHLSQTCAFCQDRPKVFSCILIPTKNS